MAVRHVAIHGAARPVEAPTTTIGTTPAGATPAGGQAGSAQTPTGATPAGAQAGSAQSPTSATPAGAQAGGAQTSTVAPPTMTGSPTPPPPSAPTTVATLAGNVPGSSAPGTPPDETVPGSWHGYPSALPVIAEQSGWLDVRLAQRPNESTAWIPASTATLSTDPYRMTLNLTSEHLSVYDGNQLLMDAPAGIGTPDDPTVTGQYFITMTVPPPDPGYGPFVLVTSAHSDTITDWSETGDAIIAIHGPIDASADALIGTTGAAISHGCIRLHDSDLGHLAGIPAGTPLEITS